MSETVLNAACDYIFQSGTTAGICFFGGEPLLEKGLLQKAVTRCQQHAKETGIPFQCKMTTNGTLLDKAFIQYAKSIGMQIGLSFDGTGQDRCRRYRDGSGTFSDLERNAKLLLEQLPNSYAMMTIAPEAVDTYTDSVKYLYRLGFRNMNATLAYGKRVLNDFLRQLTRQSRTYFIRRYWYGESIREIAAACGAGEEKIKSSLFRTRQRLRQCLEKEGML